MREIIIDLHLRQNSLASDRQVEVSEARFSLISDTSKLDKFIRELEIINSGDGSDAFFCAS